MTRNDSGAYRAAIAEMRRLVRGAHDTPEELEKLRSRIASERHDAQSRIMKMAFDRLGDEIRPIVEEHTRRRERTRREVAETMERLDTAASERAASDTRRFHGYRVDYLKAFGDQLAALEGVSQMKFRTPVEWSSDDSDGTCTYSGVGSFHLSPWIGPDSTVSSEIAPGTTPPGMWLYPRLMIDSNSCEDVRRAMTWQDVAYSLPPRDQTFGMTAVRVDLIANGFGSSILGDTGWFSSPDPLYEHSYVHLDVYLSQLVNGEWQAWPLVSERLFSGQGGYSRELRAVLSGQTYPQHIFLRSPSVGGGEILCYVSVTCSVQPIGMDGRVRLDFGATNAHGIYLGGVALLGGPL